MPFLLYTAVLSALQWLVPKLLAALGAVAVSAAVITPIFDWLQSQIVSRLNGAPSDVVNFLAFMGVFDAVSIVFAAYGMAITIKAGKAAFSKSGGARV